MTKISKETFSVEVKGGEEPQDQRLTKHEDSTRSETANTRRPGMSKREIMEQLSRERFPWDE
jgi:hypothetical protein